jgi:hypothetical protein
VIDDFGCKGFFDSPPYRWQGTSRFAGYDNLPKAQLRRREAASTGFIGKM